MLRRKFLKATLICGTVGLVLLNSLPIYCRAATASFTSHTEAAQRIVERMTLAEKIGQMTQGELNNIQEESDIENYFLGSVLSGNGRNVYKCNTPLIPRVPAGYPHPGFWQPTR